MSGPWNAKPFTCHYFRVDLFLEPVMRSYSITNLQKEVCVPALEATWDIYAAMMSHSQSFKRRLRSFVPHSLDFLAPSSTCSQRRNQHQPCYASQLVCLSLRVCISTYCFLTLKFLFIIAGLPCEPYPPPFPSDSTIRKQPNKHNRISL